MEELAGPEWWLDRKGEVPQGMQAYFRLPIVHYYNVSPAALALEPGLFVLLSPASLSSSRCTCCGCEHVGEGVLRMQQSHWRRTAGVPGY